MGKASRRKAVNTPSRFLNKAVETLRNFGWKGDIQIGRSTTPGGKISGALVRLMEDEIEDGADLEEYQACLGFIVIAWNISILNADQRKIARDNFSRSIKADADPVASTAIAMVDWLIEKKLTLFPDDKRKIISWEASLQGDNIRIQASALAPDSLKSLPND